MELFEIIGLAVITVIITLLLKKHHKEYGILAAIAGGAVILFSVITALLPITEQIADWFDSAGVVGSNLAILLKSMGICFLTQFASDTCKDAGESALASKVELAGKVAVVLTSLPLFRTIAETALSLTGGSL
ncbi:MAG: SpoIIIAC/SpoIIIAD family protein [Oscillospiraceae bacterium]|nr:SpoIIIAC/SpoIIIAD family protein [Oscillospiraceae bacterium]